jgi:6,7-dimethyl-8-ribityllumazine synthase
VTTDPQTDKQPPSRPNSLSSEGGRFAIVASRFNAQVVDRLVDGALEAFQSTGTSPDRVRVVRVPGAFELPLAVGCLLDTGDYDAVVALGCVVRGETPHFEYVSRTASDGLGRVSLDYGIPVGFGLLTTDDVEQAMARAGGDVGNKGFDAAIAAIEMTQILGDL